MKTQTTAVVLILLLFRCASDERVPSKSLPDSTPEEFFASMSEMPLLAIEVEITASGVHPVSSEVLLGPRPTNAAQPDLIVDAPAEGGALAYTIGDPRFVEIEGEGARVLDSARTYIYVPLDYSVTGVTLRRVAGAQERVTAGGVIDPRSLMVDACRREPAVAASACQQVLRAAARR